MKAAGGEVADGERGEAEAVFTFMAHVHIDVRVHARAHAFMRQLVSMWQMRSTTSCCIEASLLEVKLGAPATTQ